MQLCPVIFPNDYYRKRQKIDELVTLSQYMTNLTVSHIRQK
jgi:hypothetical protein